MASWVHQLLDWFSTEQRPMPWRQTPSSYGTWISEMMLQQTQVATVIPYFERFMTLFPTVFDLAAADEQTVLKAWEGLGYYSRARNLHKASKILVSDYNGKLPDNYNELLKLPGIGPYCAAAISSIAFSQPSKILVSDYNGKLPDNYNELLKLPGIGPYCAAAISSIAFSQPVPVVDGNVLRVFTRFWGIFDDIRQNSVKDMLFHKLSHYIKDSNPSDFNQAIMECGALICTPKQVKCAICPISTDCFAFKHDKVHELPFKSKKGPTPHYTIAVGVVFKNNKILIGQRKSDQMLGGLWEFPGGKQEKNEALKDTVKRELKEECNIEVEVEDCIKIVKHAYSHFKITLHAYRCHYISGDLIAKSAKQLKWVKKAELDLYPFPKANKAFLTLI